MKRGCFLLVACLLLATGCADEYQTAADCLADEVYDPVDQLCYLAEEEGAVADSGGFEAQTADDCLADEIYDPADQLCYLAEDSDPGSDSADGYFERPEDCFDDEYYDPVDRLCYLAVDCPDGEASCEALTDDVFSLIGEVLGGFMSGSQDFSEMDEFGEDAIVIYPVNGNELGEPQPQAVTDELVGYQQDLATHQRIWVYFANLIPLEQRRFLTGYAIFTDGEEEVLAAVNQAPDDPKSWMLSVDIVDADNLKELTYSLIHEFGHLLTLSNSQVPANETLFYEPDNEAAFETAADSCPTYFPGEGCSTESSYINRFFNAFWAGTTYEEWLDADSMATEDGNDDALLAFYDTYRDQFVTDYAATNVGEDIAESFTAFILQPRPAGNSIAEQKIEFFYSYPELLTLRAHIVSRAYARFRRQ